MCELISQLKGIQSTLETVGIKSSLVNRKELYEMLKEACPEIINYYETIVTEENDAMKKRVEAHFQGKASRNYMATLGKPLIEFIEGINLVIESDTKGVKLITTALNKDGLSLQYYPMYPNLPIADVIKEVTEENIVESLKSDETDYGKYFDDTLKNINDRVEKYNKK